ncbi:MAG TPA: hypothetical protein VKQ30_26160 [Ktedonobacterales bacterium]|nr:hypothetical protein [Ktedonobacterales bacterium]
MSDSRRSQPDDQPAASHGKARTWPHGVPALRLNRRAPVIAAVAVRPNDAAVADLGTPPRLLWLRRFICGVLLLALAWLCLLLVASLGMSAWESIPHQKISLHLLLYVLEVAGACWVGLAAIGCIVAGAFCLALAFTTRKW